MGEPPIVHEIDCPRCHAACGWCADYRWMHGTLSLPGTRMRCAVAGMEPEGDACPLCHGSRRVRATTTYEPVAAMREARGDG